METLCGTPYAVVANRGSGSISFVSYKGSSNNNFDLPLPTTPSQPEPMYVSYSNDRIYVGDRANNAVVVINPEDPMELSTVITDVCQGILHQWCNDETLVVACDISNTVAVINLEDTSLLCRSLMIL
jgi:hypothetical protein